MEKISWLEPTEDLNATLVEPSDSVDFAAGIRVPGGETITLLVEMKESLRPSDVPRVADQMRRYTGQGDFSERLYTRTGIRASRDRIVLLVGAKWLSPRTQEELRRFDLGWFDLAGNAHIEFPGVYLHVEGVANPFKEKTPGIPWKSEHAQRVFRVLLDPGRRGHAWRQREIEEACVPKVSLGTVNKVAKKLVNEAYAEESEEGLVVRDASGLLKQWAQHYSPPYQRVRKFYTLLHGDALLDGLRDFCANRGNRFPSTETDFALAGLSAAKWQAPYVRDATLYCYGTPMAAEQLKERLELEESPEGANVIFWETAKPDPFLEAVEVSENLFATNPVQTYLDLSAGGERSREAAEFLFEHRLKQEWEGGDL
ncbi:MAG: type IV toxin-antitoxin system AbiEi family antitoxin [Verrucomicrobiales bacterium]